MESRLNLTADSPVPSNLTKLQSEVKLLTETVENHQKLLEQKDRESRANNIIILGLEEDEQEEDTETLSKVNNFIETKLGLTPNRIIRAHRLGKRRKTPSKPRPVLVSFQSSRDKASVMAK